MKIYEYLVHREPYGYWAECPEIGAFVSAATGPELSDLTMEQVRFAVAGSRRAYGIVYRYVDDN